MTSGRAGEPASPAEASSPTLTRSRSTLAIGPSTRAYANGGNRAVVDILALSILIGKVGYAKTAVSQLLMQMFDKSID